jgi:8-oxo-dGTP pyrophosphatase MutT (NUDIX family)
LLSLCLALARRQVKRAGTGFADGSYSLPCGHMDGGETAAQAMQREALEELGARRRCAVAARCAVASHLTPRSR